MDILSTEYYLVLNTSDARYRTRKYVRSIKNIEKARNKNKQKKYVIYIKYVSKYFISINVCNYIINFVFVSLICTFLIRRGHLYIFVTDNTSSNFFHHQTQQYAFVASQQLFEFTILSSVVVIIIDSNSLRLFMQDWRYHRQK